jgi:CRISPR-associated protein Cas2
MSQHAPAHWLVTYDIVDKRDLARVFKLLKKKGTPVQYSVFFVPTSAAQMGSLMVQLAKLINAKTDDVRAYRLPEGAWTATLGATIVPEDLWIDAAGKL